MLQMGTTGIEQEELCGHTFQQSYKICLFFEFCAVGTLMEMVRI
jgi:hypothetical protein